MAKDLADATAWALTRVEQASCMHLCLHPAPGATARCCVCGKVWTREAFLTERFRRPRLMLWDEAPPREPR